MGSGVKVSSAAGASPPGQLRPKRLVSLLRNGWSDSTEMGGQLGAKRVVRLERNTQVRPELERANQRWSMDLMSEAVASGRRFRCLNTIDEFTRECLAIEVSLRCQRCGSSRSSSACGAREVCPT